jgi:hypothetical protein
MDQIRNIGTQNKSLIVNVIYIAAVAVIVYYMVKYYNETNRLDISLQGNKRTGANIANTAPDTYLIHDGTDAANQSTLDRRIKKGGAYTFSGWFYLNSQEALKTPLMKILEQTNDINSAISLLEIGLYGGANKMYIRSKTSDANFSTIDLDPTNTTPPPTLAMCDVLDVDYQRWIQVTVVVNGRIMDVYMDGKLARSCVLPAGQSILNTAGNSKQVVSVFKFPGFYSGLYFQAYAATPDLIYARYQMGPYSKGSFIDYLVDKLGIKITYAGVGGVTQTIQKSDWFE